MPGQTAWQGELPLELSAGGWLLLALAAVGVGMSKSGLAGIGLVHVLVFAFVFGARASTGVLLPLLVVGDACAVWFVGRHVDWAYVRRLLPPALAGVLAGWLLLDRLDEAAFRPLIGAIILALAVGQAVRTWRPGPLAHVPHAAWFAATMGMLAGITTMLANAAGPVVALYLLAVALPKAVLVSTAAWFFLILNVTKIPISASLGLIGTDSLLVNAALAPCVVAGMLLGRWIVAFLPQRLFDMLLLAFTAAAAVRLIST